MVQMLGNASCKSSKKRGSRDSALLLKPPYVILQYIYLGNVSSKRNATYDFEIYKNTHEVGHSFVGEGTKHVR